MAPVHPLPWPGGSSGGSLWGHIWCGTGRPWPVLGHWARWDPYPGAPWPPRCPLPGWGDIPRPGASGRALQPLHKLSGVTGRNPEKQQANLQRSNGEKNLTGQAFKSDFLLPVGRRRHLTACEGEGAKRRAEARGGRGSGAAAGTSRREAAPPGGRSPSGLTRSGHQLEGVNVSQLQKLLWPRRSLSLAAVLWILLRPPRLQHPSAPQNRLCSAGCPQLHLLVSPARQKVKKKSARYWSRTPETPESTACTP